MLKLGQRLTTTAIRQIRKRRVCAAVNSTFKMQNSTVSYNQAEGTNTSGGGVYGMNFNTNKGTIIIKGSSSISNNTSDSGGGIEALYKLTIEGVVTITNNKALTGFGGGVFCGHQAQVELKGCIIEGNTAKQPGYGYGVYVSYFNNADTSFKMSGNTKIHKNNNVVLSGSTGGTKLAFITLLESGFGKLKPAP